MNRRTSTNRAGCPGCAGKVPTDANNLLKWCQDNGEWGQKLVAEWAEPDVNMKDVLPATNKKLSWRCSAGCTVDGEPFTWESTLNSRTCSIRAGCPGCSGRVPTDEHNLLKWCQDNGEYGQKVIAEWAEPDVNMKDMLPASNKKLLWRCPSGCMEDGQPFTWEARVSSRTEGRGCPGCAGFVPTDANNLRKWCEDNGGYGQKLVAEWAEQGVDMKDVMHASAKKMTWRCSSGCTVDGESFTWEAGGSHRTSSDRCGCPGCAGQVPTDANNLRKWCEDNKEYGQKLIEEWAEPDVNMKDVLPGTHEKHLWRCSAGCTLDGEPFTWE